MKGAAGRLVVVPGTGHHSAHVRCHSYCSPTTSAFCKVRECGEAEIPLPPLLPHHTHTRSSPLDGDQMAVSKLASLPPLLLKAP